MNYYKAKTKEDFKFIASLFRVDNTQYMLNKKVDYKSLMEANELKQKHYIEPQFVGNCAYIGLLMLMRIFLMIHDQSHEFIDDIFYILKLNIIKKWSSNYNKYLETYNEDQLTVSFMRLLTIFDFCNDNFIMKNTTSTELTLLYSDLNNIFNDIDLTIIPSIWYDNSPTVIYESYVNNTPVLVSNIGGSKELVEEGKTGFIYKYNQYSDMCAKLDKIAQNRADLAKYGANGYEFIKQFEVSKYIDKLKNI